MQAMNDVKLNYDDITIVPETLTDIDSRSQCNPYDSDGYLPIFASCMTSVVSLENAENFNAAKIRVVIPRSYSVDERLKYLFEDNVNFVAFSLNETKDLFIDRADDLEMGRRIYDRNARFTGDRESTVPIRVCIDLANGHMKSLLRLVKELKAKYGDSMLIMTGNIANPETYRAYEDAGVDYVRVSIGTGNVCSTSSNTAVHYPPFSLIMEIYKIKNSINGHCKIIADGGIRGFRDIQKALIYADYVMVGSLFNKAIESAGKTTYGTFYWNIRGKKIARPFKTLFNFGKEVPKSEYENVYSLVKQGKLTVWKENFGMSTKIAQSFINKANDIEAKKLKTSEGLLKYQKVEFNLPGWAENETDYLRSAMSYTNSTTLEDYKDSLWARITNIRYNN
jgi:hypothetical protein